MTVQEGLHVYGTCFGLSTAFCALETHTFPAVPVAEVAAKVFQGPTSTLATHSTSSLGRSQEETSWADSVMLGYASLAKAWNVAHSGWNVLILL